MKVHEVMTAHARCVAPENTLVEAAGLMRTMDVGALPICEDDRLAGMITDRDIVLRCVADGLDPQQATVREAMTPGIVWIFADQSVEDAAKLMEDKQIRRLPVVNREKKLVGVVSLGDLAISSNPAFSGHALRDISQPDSPNSRQRRLIMQSEPATPAQAVANANQARAQSSTRRKTAATAAKRKTSTRSKPSTNRMKKSSANRMKKSSAKRKRVRS